MDTKNRNIDFIFSEHKTADIKLEKCVLKEILPSETDKLTVTKGCLFVITLQGKGNISFFDKRMKLAKGIGAAIPYGYSVQIKSDNFEPLTVIYIRTTGDSTKALFTLIESKENSIIMNLTRDIKITESALDLMAECSKQYYSDYGILYRFYEFIYSIETTYSDKKIPSKNTYMARAVEYIEENFNKNISVENIANILGIERSYLSRLFKAHKNTSTQNYIIDYRINKAKRMFEEEDMNVSQVSAAVGYSNIYCFSRIFKSRVGVPPKEYMENCRKKI